MDFGVKARKSAHMIKLRHFRLEPRGKAEEAVRATHQGRRRAQSRGAVAADVDATFQWSRLSSDSSSSAVRTSQSGRAVFRGGRGLASPEPHLTGRKYNFKLWTDGVVFCAVKRTFQLIRFFKRSLPRMIRFKPEDQ